MQQWARLILIAMEAVWSILPISFSELSSSYLCDGYWWLAPPVCSYRSDPLKFDRHEVVLIVTRTRLIIEFKSWDIEVMSKVNLTEKKKNGLTQNSHSAWICKATLNYNYSITTHFQSRGSHLWILGNHNLP